MERRNPDLESGGGLTTFLFLKVYSYGENDGSRGDGTIRSHEKGRPHGVYEAYHGTRLQNNHWPSQQIGEKTTESESEEQTPLAPGFSRVLRTQVVYCGSYKDSIHS